jgi:hypothetical protein
MNDNDNGTYDTNLGFDVGGHVGLGSGTSSRVAAMLLLSAGALAAFKVLGFRFNVGVGG